MKFEILEGETYGPAIEAASALLTGTATEVTITGLHILEDRRKKQFESIKDHLLERFKNEPRFFCTLNNRKRTVTVKK